MRTKRTKQYKRLMALYSVSFGFREPYQILVDGDFMRTALRYKMDISRQLCTVMLGNTKQSEIKGEDEFDTAAALKKFEKRGCIHRHKPTSSAECISSIIGSDNLHNYCVATQNESLRERFRVVPGVPLLYINRTVLIVEPPSYATLQKAKQVENAKTHASAEELSFLTKANSEKQTETEKPKKKRKGPKQPNSLSCKKKKVKVTSQKIESKNKDNEIGKVEKTKESTNKKRKHDKDDYGNYDSQNQPQETDNEKHSTNNDNLLNKKKRKRRKKSKKVKESE